jgi:hypothetical protein
MKKCGVWAVFWTRVLEVGRIGNAGSKLTLAATQPLEMRYTARKAALGSKPRPPPAHPRTVPDIILAEGPTQGRFLVPHHEHVARQKKQRSEPEKRKRLVDECGGGENEPSAEVHRISHQAIRSLHDQSPRRIEGRRGSLANKGEREDAPDREPSPDDCYDDADYLRRTRRCRPYDPRPAEHLSWQEHEDETDKERHVNDCTD